MDKIHQSYEQAQARQRYASHQLEDKTFREDIKKKLNQDSTG